MNIYITRHGETKYNKLSLMQGRTDEPLNETGILQAEKAKGELEKIKFDAVYSSPLCRAVKTASIMGNISEDKIIQDERIIEVDFGPYELKPYGRLGLHMTLYWIYPFILKPPANVEALDTVTKRVSSFVNDLLTKDYENVLIVCHGGIVRVLSGIFENRKRKAKWFPKPHNCEIRKYSVKNN